MPHHILGWDNRKYVLSIIQTNVLYTSTEKYTPECVMVYNFGSHNRRSFFSSQDCCIFE